MKSVENSGSGGCSPSQDRAEPAEIWKARRFIHEHSDEGLSLKKVAQAVKISPNYLSEKFKKVIGENFVGYINRRRIEKARDLLLKPDLRISEIAFAVGFQSLSQFNRVFRKFSGKSPTEYRAATRAKTVCRHMRTLRHGAQHRSSVLRAGDDDQGHTLRA